MNAELFVYGTLTDPSVRFAVVGREATVVSDAPGGCRIGTLKAGREQYPVIDPARRQ